MTAALRLVLDEEAFGELVAGRTAHLLTTTNSPVDLILADIGWARMLTAIENAMREGIIRLDRDEQRVRMLHRVVNIDVDRRRRNLGAAALLGIIELATKAYGPAAVDGDPELITALGQIAGIAARALGEPRTCRVCGCTDERACPGGCSWVEEDLCSACAGEPCLPAGLQPALDETAHFDLPHERPNGLQHWRNPGHCPECGGDELEDGPRGGAAINRRCVECGAWWNTLPELQMIQRIREDEPRQYGRTITPAERERLSWLNNVCRDEPGREAEDLIVIPDDDWDAWVLAPSGLTYEDVEAWARMAGFGDHPRIRLSTGETLVRRVK
jgi:hypothetical protein